MHDLEQHSHGSGVCRINPGLVAALLTELALKISFVVAFLEIPFGQIEGSDVFLADYYPTGLEYIKETIAQNFRGIVFLRAPEPCSRWVMRIACFTAFRPCLSINNGMLKSTPLPHIERMNETIIFPAISVSAVSHTTL